MNVKALFVNHVEKMGFGVIVFAVVLIWAKEYFGGSWKLERRNPNALIAEIKQKREEINRGKWPEEKRQEFALVDFSDRAATLLRPIDVSKYELSTELFVPLNRPKEKAREPDFLAVESLTADPGHVILALYPLDEFEGMDEGEMPLADAKEDMGEEEEDNRFVRRDVATGLEELPAEEMEPEEFRKQRFKGTRKQALGAGAVKWGGDALAGQGKAVRGDKGAGLGGGDDFRTTSGQRPQGRFYVSVRGVWPIRQQLERIQNAMKLPTTNAALDHLQILDFELQRQTAAAGDDPWSKEWQTLDIKYAQQILEEVDGFDDEPLDMAVFDTVITMPLPMRMFGVWKDHATHPRVKNYELSPEEQQRERALQARVKEAYEKDKAEFEKQRGPVPGGFAGQSNDFRDMSNRMSRNNPMAANELYGDIARDMRGAQPGGARGEMTAADLTAKVTAVGRLLLFRYFDFDVQPGYAYRYRVKLKLQNPNYQRDAAEVVDPSVAEGESRMTPESNISNAAVLPVSPRYFLKDVERNPLAEEGRRGREVASVAIYEWHKKMGTQVYATVPLDSLGQFLGGKVNTDVLDVATPVIDKEDYNFTTDDVLLDVAASTTLAPENHPDLILPPKGRGAKTVSLGIAPEALIVSGGGDLKVISGGKASSDEKSLQDYAKREREPFKDMVRPADEELNPLDFALTKGEMDPGRGKGRGKGTKGGGPEDRPGMMGADPNPRRKGGGRGGRDAMGAGAGGMGAGFGPGGVRGAGAGAMPPAGGVGKGKAKGKR